MQVNVLITSAGRRVRLVEIFQKTLREFGGRVYATDMDPLMSAACHRADEAFQVPPIKDEEAYISSLLQICKERNISIVVPTLDPELAVLAKNRSLFESIGVCVAVSDVKICSDFAFKSTTYEAFMKLGFKTPKIVTDLKNATYPLFAKLDNSSLSKGAQKVESYEEAKICLERDANYIFQEFIDAQEYTVDLFIDRRGNVISVVPRMRLEVRCGEVSKAKSCKDRQIIDEVKKFAQKLEGAYGVLCVQVFKTDNEIVFIEVNPRFGGGYPLSYESGANFAKFLVLDYLQEELEYDENWQEKVMLRYDSEVIVDGSCF